VAVAVLIAAPVPVGLAAVGRVQPILQLPPELPTLVAVAEGLLVLDQVEQVEQAAPASSSSKYLIHIRPHFLLV
jgi:hypothetical protein